MLDALFATDPHDREGATTRQVRRPTFAFMDLLPAGIQVIHHAILSQFFCYLVIGTTVGAMALPYPLVYTTRNRLAHYGHNALSYTYAVRPICRTYTRWYTKANALQAGDCYIL